MPDNQQSPTTDQIAQPTPGSAPATSRFTDLREGWNNAWAKDGVLYEKWEDLRQAPELGWHLMANWIKTALSIVGICFAIILVTTALDVASETLDRLLAAAPTVKVGVDNSSGIWGVIDNPVRSYIAAHSASLTISASTVYTLWQLTGLAALMGGVCRSTGARLTWLGHGAATIAMVWQTAPAEGRTIATAITVLAWTLASVIALRGLSLRPTVFTHIHNAVPEIRPEIHIPAPPRPADPAPDNIRPLR